MRPLILLLFGPSAIFAQPFTAGIKAGVPLTDFLNASENGVFNYSAPTQRYIIGGTAELRLPLGLGIEFDALYRRLHYTGSGNLVDVFTTSNTTASNWEFPLLLKYRFHFPVVRPFLDAGVAWDTLTGLKQTISEVGPVGLTSTSSPSELRRNTTMGFVVGGGVDIHAIVLHISPEIRFTRWNATQISDPAGLLRSNLNQAEFLVGFTF
ncbi:MAG TPA: outer membrane beta-barrel protein [Bryobacteraceae bacterium]|nr:outer membrane beta-barrel protein [Bryobacteraceae bacterium]